jgi:hypothetical protein
MKEMILDAAIFYFFIFNLAEEKVIIGPSSCFALIFA